MTDQIREFASELSDLANIALMRTVVDEHIARGDAAFVADLAITLAETHGEQVRREWGYRTAFDYLLRSLAITPGRHNTTEAVRLVTSVWATDEKLERYAASLLAASHPAEDLSVVFTGQATDELRACLVHELLLRGAAVEQVPGIADWSSSPGGRHHPQAWLPSELSDVEDCPELPTYSLLGSSFGYPNALTVTGNVVDGGTAAELGVPRAQESTTEAAATAIAAAAANWAVGSNGVIEARVFEFAEALGTGSLPTLLPTLALECLDGLEDETWPVCACTPTHAWQVLHAAASGGGAYNRMGELGAYGRLAAWRSMAALSGAPEGASFREVEARVGASAWHVFDTKTPWFERVVWDIALAVISPDRRRLAVLAATDTD